MKYLVCNFKNKLLKNDIIKYNNEIDGIDANNCKLVLCPPFPYISMFNKNGYDLGSQDVSSFMDKTITGEVNAEQLRSLGISYVIVGHSEKREYKKEINIDFINKINNNVINDLTTIYCIGESLSDRENGYAFSVLEKQISEVLNNVELKKIIIAYEPVWSIGTGITPTLKEIEETVKFIKDTIREKYEIKIDVLYGGSVNTNNIADLLTIKNVDGFLVGGASLDANNVKTMLEKMR